MLVQIDCVYSDKGTEHKGTDSHAFVAMLNNHHINQKFTRLARSQTNGKAERVIRTLMQCGTSNKSVKMRNTVSLSYYAALTFTIPLSLTKH